MRASCSGVRIRKAREADAPRLRRAFQDIARESRWLLTEPGEVPRTDAVERAFIRKHLRSPNSLLLVAEVDKEIVGVSGLMGSPLRRARHVAGVGISLRAAWTGKGIGTEMLSGMIAWARRHGLRRLHLSVIVENDVAIHLYRRMGFVEEGVARKNIRIGRRFYDTIEMAKLL